MNDLESTYHSAFDRRWPAVARGIPWALLTLGAVLRVAQYAYNRSFWIDECFLALASTDKSYAQLLQPLPLNQAAPLGYLYLQKIAVSVFGTSEYVLRLIPLAAGLASLPLFWATARRYVEGVALWFALGLFAVSDSLIYYSSEAKQYSSDVAVALGCYLLAERLGDSLPARRLLAVSFIGAAFVWFSHPAVFVLAGIVVAIGVDLLLRRDWTSLGRHCLVFSAWGASFSLLYRTHLSHASANAFLHQYWRFAYMPLGGFPAAQVLWLMRMSAGLFQMLSVSWEPVPAIIAAVGAVALWRRSRVRCIALAAPVLAVLVASALHRYPFNGRLILFLAPNLILFLAAAIEVITRRNTLLGTILAILILLHPVEVAFDCLLHPRERADTRAAVVYLTRNLRTGDVVYASWEAQFHFDYYAKLFGTRFERYVRGQMLREGARGYMEPLESLRGSPRVWMLFSRVLEWDSHSTPGADPEESKTFGYVDAAGRQLSSFRVRGASVFLYDLAAPPPPDGGAGASRESALARPESLGLPSR